MSWVRVACCFKLSSIPHKTCDSRLQLDFRPVSSVDGPVLVSLEQDLIVRIGEGCSTHLLQFVVDRCLVGRGRLGETFLYPLPQPSALDEDISLTLAEVATRRTC